MNNCLFLNVLCAYSSLLWLIFYKHYHIIKNEIWEFLDDILVYLVHMAQLFVRYSIHWWQPYLVMCQNIWQYTDVFPIERFLRFWIFFLQFIKEIFYSKVFNQYMFATDIYFIISALVEVKGYGHSIYKPISYQHPTHAYKKV